MAGNDAVLTGEASVDQLGRKGYKPIKAPESLVRAAEQCGVQTPGRVLSADELSGREISDATPDALGVSSVHLSNVERGVTPPSASLMARLTEVYGVDVYVLCYCTSDDDDEAPEGVNLARRKLAEALRRQLGDAVKTG